MRPVGQALVRGRRAQSVLEHGSWVYDHAAAHVLKADSHFPAIWLLQQLDEGSPQHRVFFCGAAVPVFVDAPCATTCLQDLLVKRVHVTSSFKKSISNKSLRIWDMTLQLLRGMLGL